MSKIEHVEWIGFVAVLFAATVEGQTMRLSLALIGTIIYVHPWTALRRLSDRHEDEGAGRE